jgi:hypothetical protein
MATAFEFDITTGWPLAAMSGGHASLHAQCPASHRGAGCVHRQQRGYGVSPIGTHPLVSQV